MPFICSNSSDSFSYRKLAFTTVLLLFLSLSHFLSLSLLTFCSLWNMSGTLPTLDLWICFRELSSSRLPHSIHSPFLKSLLRYSVIREAFPNQFEQNVKLIHFPYAPSTLSLVFMITWLICIDRWPSCLLPLAPWQWGFHCSRSCI